MASRYAAACIEVWIRDYGKERARRAAWHHIARLRTERRKHGAPGVLVMLCFETAFPPEEVPPWL